MLVLTGATTLGLGSCAAPTDITVQVTTDFPCSALQHVTVTVGTLGHSLETDRWSTMSATCQDGYAGRLVVIPSGSKNELVAIKIVAGYGGTKHAEDCTATVDDGAPDRPRYGPGCIVARRALHFTPHVPLQVPVVLHQSCDAVVCPDTQTCVGRGQCVPALIGDTAACARAGGCGESALGGGDAGAPDGAARDATVADTSVQDGLGLLGLTLTAGTLSPPFSPATLTYGVVTSVASLGVPFMITPTLASGASATIGEAMAVSGVASTIALNLLQPTVIDITVAPATASPVKYPIVVPPVQEAYVKASNSRTQVAFGQSLALSDDTLAVGTLAEASNATGVNGAQGDTSLPNAGAVYVFTRTGSTWTQQAYLKASNTRAQALFGASVALSGNTLAVAAPEEDSAASGVDVDQQDSSAPNAGAV